MKDKFFLHQNTKKNISKVIIFFSVLAFLPIMWIAMYSHPSSDDYNYSEIYTQSAVNNGGNVIEIIKAAFKTSLYFQNCWQGTYSASFLDSLHPGIYGTHEEFYALTPYIICLSIFITLYLFMREFFLACGWKTKHMIPLTLVTMLTFIEGFPSPVQGLFWYTGAMTYMFFWALSLLQCALLLSCNRSAKYFPFKIFISLLNAFIIAGGNHITSFITILISLGFFCYSIISKKLKHCIAYLLCSIVSIIGFIIVMTAPGTTIRANLFERPSIIKTMLVSIFNTLCDIEGYTNLPLLLLFCLIILLLGIRPISGHNYQLFKFRFSLLMFILSFGIYCASFCVPYYAMGSSGAGRVSDMRYALFVILALINFLYLYGCILAFIYANKKLKILLLDAFNTLKGTLTPRFFSVSCIIFTVFAMTVIVFFSYRTSVTTNCTMEILNGEAKAYHEEKLQYLGTDLPNPTHMPKMIYFSSHMPDA